MQYMTGVSRLSEGHNFLFTLVDGLYQQTV